MAHQRAAGASGARQPDVHADHDRADPRRGRDLACSIRSPGRREVRFADRGAGRASASSCSSARSRWAGVDHELALGPLSLTPLTSASGSSPSARSSRSAFWLAGRLGFGPLAPPPARTTAAASSNRPRRPPEGWLRLGWRLGLPAVWMVARLLVLPVVVYVISYLPWAVLGQPARGRAGRPATPARRCSSSPSRCTDYHNNLRAAARRVLAVVGVAARPQAGLVLPGRLRRRHRGVDLRRRQPRHLVAGHPGDGVLRVAGLQAAEPGAGADRRSASRAQWLPWARIDRAAFQYHYYTSLPFIILALGVLPGRALARRVAPDLARWPGSRPRVAILGPGILWIAKAPLCALRRRRAGQPGLAGVRGQSREPRGDPGRGGHRGRGRLADRASCWSGCCCALGETDGPTAGRPTARPRSALIAVAGIGGALLFVGRQLCPATRPLISSRPRPRGDRGRWSASRCCSWLARS